MLHLIAIDVGNSRTQAARFAGDTAEGQETFPNADRAGLLDQVAAWWNAMADEPRTAVVVASVNDDVADELVSAFKDQLSIDVYRIGDDIPVPIGRRLDPETITGVDRLLNAAAAYDVLQQACIVVDAGTAVTVDFVDGEGTFHGGAIAPGARMQLAAMHEHTAALPEIAFTPPDEGEAFGRSTAQAMLRGVFFGIRGMVWKLAEQYAEAYGAYPVVVATGGDAAALFGGDELVDRIVPGLTLRGIVAAARLALTTDEATEEPPGGTRARKRSQ